MTHAKAFIVGLLLLLGESCLAFDPQRFAVVFNRLDRDSRIIASLYADARQIPHANRIGIDLNSSKTSLPVDRFKQLYADVQQQLPSQVQAYALVWDKPYRVDCMSITSAFSFGFDRKYCAKGCKPTAPNRYFGSMSRAPWDDFQFRPTMLLSGGNTAETLALIRRGEKAGEASVGQQPSAYLVTTADKARMSRQPRYALANRLSTDRLSIQQISSEGIRDRHDVMFYFTGSKHVPHLDTLTFLPGAIADHLTSHGGQLVGSSQMSALEWIRAGATGTYGTVVEPCNFPQKFPDPPLAMAHYLNGETLIEAYWKSVQWPGQGVFVGDPLARAFPASGRAR